MCEAVNVSETCAPCDYTDPRVCSGQIRPPTDPTCPCPVNAACNITNVRSIHDFDVSPLSQSKSLCISRWSRFLRTGRLWCQSTSSMPPLASTSSTMVHPLLFFSSYCFLSSFPLPPSQTLVFSRTLPIPLFFATQTILSDNTSLF